MYIQKLILITITLLAGLLLVSIIGINYVLGAEPEPQGTQPGTGSVQNQVPAQGATEGTQGETQQTQSKEGEATPQEQQQIPPALEGSIDPFRPFIESLVTQRQQRPELPLTPLQKYNISQLKLVGIIEGSKEPKALIQDSTNKGYIITKGTLIGPNNGKVEEITSDEVIVTEEVVDAMGKTKEQKTVMKLHLQEEQKPK